MLRERAHRLGVGVLLGRQRRGLGEDDGGCGAEDGEEACEAVSAVGAEVVGDVGDGEGRGEVGELGHEDDVCHAELEGDGLEVDPLLLLFEVVRPRVGMGGHLVWGASPGGGGC